MSEEENKAIKWLKELYDIEKDFNSSKGKEESNIIKTLLNLVEKQQNTIASKEKQIKLMQSCDLAKEIKEQEKEIEQLANGIRVLGTNPDITTEEIIKEFTEKPITEEYMKEFKSRYISKDKIEKELLEPINKERQETYKEFMKKGKDDYHGIEGSVLQELNWVVGTIEELLGE